MSTKASQRTRRSWSWFIVGVIVFGLLMAVREETHSLWLRALLAGYAFATLAAFLSAKTKNMA